MLDYGRRDAEGGKLVQITPWLTVGTLERQQRRDYVVNYVRIAIEFGPPMLDENVGADGSKVVQHEVFALARQAVIHVFLESF